MTEKFTNKQLIKKLKYNKYKRMHLSYKPIKNFKNAKQNNKSPKPLGFWYACGTEWLDYVVNDWEVSKMCCYIYSIKLKPINFTKNINKKNKNKILLIENMKHLDKFINKYSKPKNHKFKEFKINKYIGVKIPFPILWEQVAKDFVGIEFCPYILINEVENIWSFDNDFNMFFSEKNPKYLWYRILDISSGCIWNFDNLDIDCKLIANKPNKKAKKWNYL